MVPLAGILVAVCAAMMVPSMLSHTAPSGPDDVAVMSANLEYGGADAQTLVSQSLGLALPIHTVPRFGGRQACGA